MAAGSTYTKIATATTSSSQSSVTFSSIPNTYTDLVMVMSMQSSSGYDAIRINGDTAANYSRTGLTGDGTNAGSFKSSGAAETRLPIFGAATLPTSGNSFFTATVDFMNYSNTTTYKTIISRDGAAATGVDIQAGLWRSTSAINEIIIYPHYNIGSGTFNAGCTFTIYGIAAA